jgi:hypothetical protein
MNDEQLSTQLATLERIRENQRKANKKYRESHPEKFREYSKKYYDNNREKRKEAMKESYAKKKVLKETPPII